MRGLRGQTARVRVAPLPRENDIGFGAAAMIVIENTGNLGFAEPAAGLERFGFTRAESEIAGGVHAGKSVRDIARERKVAYETVRAQVKSVYSKADVHSRAEFMALNRR